MRSPTRTCAWGFHEHSTITTIWIKLENTHLSSSLQTRGPKKPLVSMVGRAEGQACADPRVRTPIGASGISSIFKSQEKEDFGKKKKIGPPLAPGGLFKSIFSCDEQLNKWHCYSVRSSDCLFVCPLVPLFFFLSQWILKTCKWSQGDLIWI